MILIDTSNLGIAPQLNAQERQATTAYLMLAVMITSSDTVSKMLELDTVHIRRVSWNA